MGKRVDHVEQAMGEYSTSFNTLVDAHSAHSDEILQIKDKLAYLEDRSRSNNLKVRRIPETVNATQLLQYVQDMFSALAPELSVLELTMDKVHRVPKPPFLADNVPAQTTRLLGKINSSRHIL